MYNSSTNDTSQTKEDNVNHPSHYTFSKYEVLDVLLEWFPKNPLLWQVAKYIARAEHKGNSIEDLKKARFYLNKEIERQEELETKLPICSICLNRTTAKDLHEFSLLKSDTEFMFFHKGCFERGAKVNYVQRKDNL